MPRNLWVCRLSRHLRMVEAIPHRKVRIVGAVGAVHRLEKEIAERKGLEVVGLGTSLRKDQLQFVAAALNQFRAGLRADANPIQSRRGGDCSVGLHGDLKAARMKAAIRHSSSCSRGSPPVQTTNRRSREADRGHFSSTAAAHSSADSNLPPPGPSTPTKSVSQNWHIAAGRSLSLPDQRLQPAKRQKTDGRPECAPSPCKV